MKRIIIFMLCVQVSNLIFGLTETVDGITWHYRISNHTGRSTATIVSPNVGDITDGTNFTLLPAHEGELPRVLTIPSKLGGLDVSLIGIGSIQLSDNSKVELIIVPPTVTVIAQNAILGEFVKSETSNSRSGRTYQWFFKNASEHGLNGVLFLGNKHYYDEAGQGFINIGNASHISQQDRAVFLPVNDAYSSLWPQVYYVDGIVEPYGREVNNGVRYGAAKVDIAPTGCVFDGVIDVLLSCSNSSAHIYYTLDGSEPTTNVNDRCFMYDNPITLTHGATVRALAHVAEYPYTIVYSERYALGQVLLPTIVATDGNVFNWSGNMVTLTTETDGAQIRYTLDGSEPTENSNLYTGPFTIDDTTTVKAKAFKEDWFESETATTTFTREWYTVVTPVIEPDETTFENVSQTISLSCVTEGATILYTTDGSNPKTNGREYKNPFTIYDSCTIRAIAVKYDWKDSEEITATFTRTEGLSEAVNLYGYLMETDTSNPWTVVTDVSHDGVSCVRSGAIGHGGTTWLQTSMRKAGTISFWWKAACEEAEEESGETYWYDYGSFLIDGVVKAQIAGNDTGWRKVEVDVPTGGKHVLRWEYHKDGATSYSPDCIWLDQVQWIPADGSGYTLTTPDPVPYSWLSGYGLGLDSDFESAAKQSFGKTDSNGRAMQVWQDYVAGTDPTNTMDFLRAVISFSNGMPQVSWTPNLNSNGEMRVYTVMGKTNLTDAAWTCPTNSGHRFFKVKVELP